MSAFKDMFANICLVNCVDLKQLEIVHHQPLSPPFTSNLFTIVPIFLVIKIDCSQAHQNDAQPSNSYQIFCLSLKFSDIAKLQCRLILKRIFVQPSLSLRRRSWSDIVQPFVKLYRENYIT